MTTLGKYLGAGLSFGAFGGSRALMDRFDPRLPGALKHAGTFNNNIMSMSGGLAGLRSSFTPDAADAFLQRTEAFRATVNARLAQAGLDMCLSGIGSILSLHIGAQPPMKVAQIHPQTMLLRQLVHLNCLERGLLLTPRGDIFLSLPMNEARLGEIAEILVSAVIQESPALAI